MGDIKAEPTLSYEGKTTICKLPDKFGDILDDWNVHNSHFLKSTLHIRLRALNTSNVIINPVIEPVVSNET